MLSKEELLKPRWKVIVKYPGSPWKENDILSDWNEEFGFGINKDSWERMYNPLNYPAIFKKLEWWEDRKFEDLPEYVKNADGVYKTYFSIPTKNGSLWEWTVVHPTKEFGTEFMFIIDNKMEPSTKEEYEKQNLKT